MADFEMCQDCVTLVGAGSRADPHSNLVSDLPEREPAADGTGADEQHYVCTKCGQQWIQETDNSGHGWTVRQP